MLTIICGAPNIKIGQKVPVAYPGTVLPTGMTVKKTKIREINSHGMLCAEDELGLGDDHTGILVLPQNATIGTSLTNVVKSSQAVLDIDITPNRADCLSIEGLAREVAALTRRQFLMPKVKELPKKIASHQLRVSVQEKKLCPYYVACRLSNIRIASSPAWLADLLRESGVRPVNNVVDITNYVMLATGQPMHAFDARKLFDKRGDICIYVRRAKSGETIQTLDEKIYKLDQNQLVIASATKPIALAGIMGGLQEAVDEKTTDIILEMAVFDPIFIRRGSKRLGLRTGSSTRFEKGININHISYALRMALDLYKNLAGAHIKAYAEVPKFKPKKLKSVDLEFKEFENLLGHKLHRKQIQSFLTSLGFSLKTLKGDQLRVTAPSWRIDISIPADVIEEAGRLFGFNNLPATRLTMTQALPRQNHERNLEKRLREIMIAYGFYESLSYSFYSDQARRADSLSMFCDGRFDHLEIDNPLSPEQQYLRKSIIPFILRALSKNLALIQDGSILKIFELGRIFIPQGRILPREDIILAGAMSFGKSSKEDNLLYLKGVLENIFTKLNVKAQFRVSSLKAGGIIFEYGNKPVATAYMLSQFERTVHKIKKPAGIFELSLTRLIRVEPRIFHFKALPHYPAVVRDLALEFAREVLWQNVKDTLARIRFLESVRFLSQFHISDRKKSLAFRLTFRSMDQTLTAEMVEVEINKIVSLLKNKFNAKIRGKD